MKKAMLVCCVLGVFACTAGAELIDVLPLGVDPNYFTCSYSSGNVTIDSKIALPAGAAAYTIGQNTGYSGDIYLSSEISTSASAKSEVGLIARGNMSTFSTYALTLNFNSGTFNLIKAKNFAANNLDWAEVDDIDPTKTYTMTFSAIGSNLVGKLYDGGTLIATRSATDSEYASGAFGTLGFNPVPGNYMHAVWTNAQVIPEPVTIVMLALGMGALLRRRK